MAGLLTHLIASLVVAILIYFIFYKSKIKQRLIYASVFFIANILPDLVDFGVLGVKMGSLNPSEIMQNPLFDTLAVFGHTFFNWLIIGLIIIAIASFFYVIRNISKRSFVVICSSTLLTWAGIALHLIFDRLIQEANYWI